MTAAYATGRSHVMTTIAGVAIAAALVPPLAVVGLALTNARPLISYNAAILLTTNLVAIITGCAYISDSCSAPVGAGKSRCHEIAKF
jgi:uncharacterized membrane protein